MDLDAFECPICASIFEGPIFQCKNGHAVCDGCLVRINGTCPSCREHVGDIRCRALENAIAGVVVPCAFSSHGCTQLLKLKELRDHEAFHCGHAQFACPLRRCAYSAASAPLLYDHIQNAHTPFMDYEVSSGGSAWQVWLHRWGPPFMVLMDPVDRRVFLLLNGGDVRSGRSLSLVCLGPRPAANISLEYKLEVGGAGEGEPSAAPSLSATGSVPCMRSWAVQYPADLFLFVPDAYWTSFACVLVKVHVHAIDSLPSLVRRHRSLVWLVVLVFVAMAIGKRALDKW